MIQNKCSIITRCGPLIFFRISIIVCGRGRTRVLAEENCPTIPTTSLVKVLHRSLLPLSLHRNKNGSCTRPSPPPPPPTALQQPTRSLRPAPPRPARPEKIRGRSRSVAGSAVAGLQSSSEQELVLNPKDEGRECYAGEEKAEYDWREEWYPLYLSEDVPDDAPLGLTVFHKLLVLYRDGQGAMRCYEDRCPHRLAKLSEGQLVDGRLECLYHGWQFQGDGQCVKIPQLPEGARIPRSACAKPYEVRDSQGMVWVWMSEKRKPDDSKLPFFEHYARPGFHVAVSGIHEFPYDHSILLENLMDPAHVPISHDRTDLTAKREMAQALVFKVQERTARGFAGQWWPSRTPEKLNQTRFDAPCVLQNNMEFFDEKGQKHYFSALFLCRPAGQGKSMLIVRFGSTNSRPLFRLIPSWLVYQNSGKVFEEDMGFLSSQNEVLAREKVPTRQLFLNLSSCDVWVSEYRKWMDRVGHGMPYHVGHSTISPPAEPAVVEQAPAGLVAAASASFPAKGGFGTPQAPNPASKYFRHVVYCKQCRRDLRAFEAWRKALAGMACVAAAILGSTKHSAIITQHTLPISV